MSDIACEMVLFKFVSGHGARTYMNVYRVWSKDLHECMQGM